MLCISKNDMDSWSYSSSQASIENPVLPESGQESEDLALANHTFISYLVLKSTQSLQTMLTTAYNSGVLKEDTNIRLVEHLLTLFVICGGKMQEWQRVPIARPKQCNCLMAYCFYYSLIPCGWITFSISFNTCRLQFHYFVWSGEDFV